MPWVRFDDQFPIHRRIAGLSDAAFRLHVATIFWCARNLTDGFVASEDVVNVGRTRRPWRLVDELVGAGAWHITDGGWQIHDYLVYQPSREKVLRDRALKAKAGREGGYKSGESRRQTSRSSGVRSKREAKPKQNASRLVEHPYLLPSKEGGEGRGAANATAAPTPHQNCQRCDGHGWIETDDGKAARCPEPRALVEGQAE